MSTLILGQLTRADGIGRGDDPKKHWLEALAAVIPGEALAAHTAMISFFTEKGDGADATLTSESVVVVLTLLIGFVGIPLLYGGASGGALGGKHVLRWTAAIVAFAVWLWLLPLSIWDTFVEMDADVRAGIGIVAALLVVAAAQFAFKRWPLPANDAGQ
jgi:hypothetical protein